MECLNASREAAAICKCIGAMDMLCELGVLARGDVWRVAPPAVINATTSTNATNIDETTISSINGKEGMCRYCIIPKKKTDCERLRLLRSLYSNIDDLCSCGFALLSSPNYYVFIHL